MDIKTLNEIKERVWKEVGNRAVDAAADGMKYEKHVLVCGGTGCTSGNSRKILDEFRKEIDEKGLSGKINLVMTGCFGLCALGPVVIVYPEGAFYSQVKLEHVPEIVDQHLIGGEVVTRLLYSETVG